MGSFRLVAGNRHLHRYYNFAGQVVETVPRSLHHSCGSELTRQGISLLNIITATISCAAVEELGLEVGSDAYAVIKATNVMVGIDE